MSKVFNILQITDIHFREQPEGTIYGIETQSLFERTLKQIQQEVSVSGQAIDLLLATGDISQDGSAASYQRFHQFIKRLNVRSYFLQGNHDYAQPMLDEFGQAFVAPCVVHARDMQSSPWRIVMLNSSVENQVGGHFGKAQLVFLDEQLKQDTQSPTMVCFHHHPMSINCAWLDTQTIDDAEAFFKVLDTYNNVKLCIYGHIHQDRLMIRNQVPYYSSPSTCAQFKPEMDTFALDELAPAYRWIRCHDDGSFQTEVCRLKDFDFAQIAPNK